MEKIIALSISVMLLCSCNSFNKKTSPDEAKTHSEHSEQVSSEAIELDNGVRWVVNEEMKPYILKGSELLNTYIRDKQSDYKKLAEQLGDQDNQLIKSCTMTGKSHEELHKWLHPHLELVSALANSANQNEADSVIHKIEKSYNAYEKYFQ